MVAIPCGFESHHRHQLRNSHHRSVSGFAENCAMVGISSLSAPIRLAGFGAEGRRGGGLGAVSFLSRIDKERDRHCLSLFLVPPPLPLAKTGRCGVLIEIVQEKSTKVFPPPPFPCRCCWCLDRDRGVLQRKPAGFGEKPAGFIFYITGSFARCSRLNDAMQQRLKEGTTRRKN